MILWINGAFGSGKSSIAEELNKRIDKSFLYDPEQVGYFLWDNFPDELKRKGNFQHIDIWREFNYKILKYLNNNYDGTVIVPMTIYTKQYYDEIVGNLIKDGIAVKHIILSASKQTIIDRLINRGEEENSWAEQHIDKCLSAFQHEITQIKIPTDERKIDNITQDILNIFYAHTE